MSEPVGKLHVDVGADVSGATRRLNSFAKALDKAGDAARTNAAAIDTALARTGQASERLATRYRSAGTASRVAESDTGRLAAAQARAAAASGNYSAAVSAATMRVNLATRGTVSYYNALTQQASMQRQAERADRGRVASMSTLINTMRGAMMMGGGLAVLKQGWDFAKMGASNAAVENSFRRLAASSKVSADALLENMRRAAGGTITDVELMKRANLALMSQNDAMVAKLPQLLAIARTAAEATGRDVTDAYSRLIEGIAKAEPEVLDELGIRINLTRAYAEGAAAMGKTAAQLTINEKSQIMLNEALKQGNEMIEAMGEGSSVTASRMGELETSANNLFDSIKVGAADAVVAVSDLWGAFFRDTAIGQAIFQAVRGGPMAAPGQGAAPGGFSGGAWEPKPTKAEGIGNQYIPAGANVHVSAWDVRQGELATRNRQAREEAAAAAAAGRGGRSGGGSPSGARASEAAARATERDLERLEKARFDLMSAGEQYAYLQNKLATQKLPEAERLELVKQISDLEEKIRDTRLSLQRALFNDEKADAEGLKRAQQARRVLESSTASAAQKAAARLALKDVTLSNDERQNEINKLSRTAGGASTVGGGVRSALPTGSFTPAGSTPTSIGAGSSSAGGAGVTIQNNFILDGKTIATYVTPYTLDALLGEVSAANSAGIGRRG